VAVVNGANISNKEFSLTIVHFTIFRAEERGMVFIS